MSFPVSFSADMLLGPRWDERIRNMIKQADKDGHPVRGRQIHVTGCLATLYGCELIAGTEFATRRVRLWVPPTSPEGTYYDAE